MELVKRFLQLPSDVNGFKSRVLVRVWDPESAVGKPPAPVLSLKLLCFHLGSEEIPAGITPESRELGPELTLRLNHLPKPEKHSILIPGAAFGLGAAWCLVMDLAPRPSQGSELFL